VVAVSDRGVMRRLWSGVALAAVLVLAGVAAGIWVVASRPGPRRLVRVRPGRRRQWWHGSRFPASHGSWSLAQLGGVRGIAVGPHAVWVTTGDQVVRIDPARIPP
jgi:hypothetical protein